MDEDKFDEIYLKYGPMIYRRCYFILKNEDLAEEAMHDVFIKWLTLEKKQYIINIAAYLYKMATHISLNIIKKRSRVSYNTDKLSTVMDNQDLEEMIVNKLTIEVLFSKLNPKSKLVFILRFLHKRKRQEIAEIMGLSLGAIKKRIAGIRKKALSLKEN